MSEKGEKKYFKRNHAFPLHDHALAQELLALGHKFTFQVDHFWSLLLSPFCSMRRGREEDLKKQCSFTLCLDCPPPVTCMYKNPKTHNPILGLA